MKDLHPIGIFDSGYGGLTVFRSIVSALPEYDYLYLGDNARVPYGTRSFEAVYQYTLQGVKYLFSQGCPLIIIACNTASAKALRMIQQHDLKEIAPAGRVLGVIRPTTELIGNYSKNKAVGIMATTGTVQSNSYRIEINRFFPEVKIYQQACPIWVPLIENQEWDTEGGAFFIKKYVNALFTRSAAIDTVLLACTHYPIMKEKIRQYLPGGCTLISQGPIVSQSLVRYLERHREIAANCTQESHRYFLTTDSTKKFDDHAPLFLGYSVFSQQVIL